MFILIFVKSLLTANILEAGIIRGRVKARWAGSNLGRGNYIVFSDEMLNSNNDLPHVGV